MGRGGEPALRDCGAQTRGPIGLAPELLVPCCKPLPAAADPGSASLSCPSSSFPPPRNISSTNHLHKNSYLRICFQRILTTTRTTQPKTHFQETNLIASCYVCHGAKNYQNASVFLSFFLTTGSRAIGLKGQCEVCHRLRKCFSRTEEKQKQTTKRLIVPSSKTKQTL